MCANKRTDTVVVFLGEGNSVKLGDFGLSKIILSHDFASTYVGTPFYMSPEICAAEKYSLYSDIWSLGCIIYELCTLEPPFNARTHLDLIQKIKLGKVAPLPRVYSRELGDVISACLQVNPNLRPDTAALLNLPRVKLVRKTQEGAAILQQHITAKDNAISALRAAQETIAKMEAEKEAVHNQISQQLRLEWETKAHLEITRQVDLAGEKLREHYRLLFEAQVQEEVDRRVASYTSSQTSSSHTSSYTSSDHQDLEASPRSSTPPALDDRPSALGMIGENDEDGPSADLTSLSLEDSPLVQRHKPLKQKTGRTPFTRARTFANAHEVAPSPMDIQMADQSPMSIASLALSPRRTAIEGSRLRQPAFTKADNSFDRAVRDNKTPLFPNSDIVEEDEDDDDLDSDGASPTRVRPNMDPFKTLAAPSTSSGGRPSLARQRTMPAQMHQRLKTIPSLPTSNNTTQRSTPGSATSSPTRTRLNRGLAVSPARRAPAAPSQPSPTALAAKKGGKEDMIRAVHRNNLEQGFRGKGRTLVELAQARGGIHSPERSGGFGSGENGSKVPVKAADRGVPLWDPERDEMPSPFLVRTRRPVMMPR